MSLVSNPWAGEEDKAELEIPLLTQKIYQFISDNEATIDDTNVNRASAANMCVRRRWYQRNGQIGKRLTPRKLINFKMGDVSEAVVKHYIAKSGFYKEVRFGNVTGTYTLNGRDHYEQYGQITNTFQLPTGETITTHYDGLGLTHEGEWELIEIKSTSDWGYKSFKEEGTTDYLPQAHANMLTDELTALNVRKVRFVFLRKQTGHIWDQAYKFDDALAKKVIEDFMVVLKDSIPDRPFEPQKEIKKRREGNKWIPEETGRATLGFPCTYCPYAQQCFDGKVSIDFNKKDQFGFSTPTLIVSN